VRARARRRSALENQVPVVPAFRGIEVVAHDDRPAAGAHTLYVVVDADDQIDEGAGEDNNQTAVAVTVAALPALGFSAALAAEPAAPDSLDSFDLVATVANTGVASGAFDVRFYRDGVSLGAPVRMPGGNIAFRGYIVRLSEDGSCAALFDGEAAVVQRDRQRLVVGGPELLEQQLGLGAGVYEDQRQAVRLHRRVDVADGVARKVARPGHALGRRQDTDVGRGGPGGC